MSTPLREILALKGIQPPNDRLPQLESKWMDIQRLQNDLEERLTADADIVLRNTPGGSHNG